MAALNAIRSAVKRIGEAGASLVEYTLLVALVAAVAIGAISFLGTSARDTLQCTGDQIAAQSNDVACTTTTTP